MRACRDHVTESQRHLKKRSRAEQVRESDYWSQRTHILHTLPFCITDTPLKLLPEKIWYTLPDFLHENWFLPSNLTETLMRRAQLFFEPNTFWLWFRRLFLSLIPGWSVLSWEEEQVRSERGLESLCFKNVDMLIQTWKCMFSSIIGLWDLRKLWPENGFWVCILEWLACPNDYYGHIIIYRNGRVIKAFEFWRPMQLILHLWLKFFKNTLKKRGSLFDNEPRLKFLM